jgi:predicted porin
MSLGAAFKVGGGDIVVQLARVDDKTAANNDAQLMAVAYYYSLSKATTVYASYGKLNNSANGTRSMMGQAVGTTAAGQDPSALALGWKITF